MPKKKNKSGRLQEYDPHTGRYVNEMPFLIFESRRKKKTNSEMLRRQDLKNRASKAKDPLLEDVFLEIEAAFPGSVKNINFFLIDNGGKEREFDIETRTHIIEVKSGKAKHQLTQLVEQKKCAETYKKRHIVFAPKISYATRTEYERHGIKITTSINELIKQLGEKR